MTMVAANKGARLPFQTMDASFIIRSIFALGVILSAFTVIHDVHNIRLGNEILNALYQEEMRLVSVKSNLLLELSNLTTLGQIESQAILRHEMQHLQPSHVEVWR